MRTIARVFVPHEPCRFDSVAGKTMPIYDLRPAEVYGIITPLLPEGPIKMSTGEIVGVIQESLFDFGDRDYIMCVGDPVIIALATMVASRLNDGVVTLLKYDRREKAYHPVRLNVNEES